MGLDLFTAMEVSASGLTAERVRMNALASNLANARTTRTAQGGPYKRLDPVFQAVPLAMHQGAAVGTRHTGAYLVEVPTIRQDEGAPQMMYDPQHPDADERGFVALPNVNVVEEMTNMISASRSYQANVEVLNTAKTLMVKTLTIGQ